MASEANEIRVTVFTHDGRPAYEGAVTDINPGGRLEVRNDETGEYVAVPISSVAPTGATFECDCESCLEVWGSSGLAEERTSAMRTR